MFDVTYEGLRIQVTLAASRELAYYGYDLEDVKEILETGYECSASQRKLNIIERCINKGRKEYKAVVIKVEVTYPDNYKEEVWRLIHFGKNTWRRK